MNNKVRKAIGILYLVIYILTILVVILISFFAKDIGLDLTQKQLVTTLAIIFFAFAIISVIFITVIKRRK